VKLTGDTSPFSVLHLQQSSGEIAQSRLGTILLRYSAFGHRSMKSVAPASRRRYSYVTKARVASAVSQFVDPLFQNRLVVSLDLRENDSHVTLRRGIGHLAESQERTAFAGNSDTQLCSSRKRFAGSYAAAVYRTAKHRVRCV